MIKAKTGFLLTLFLVLFSTTWAGDLLRKPVSISKQKEDSLSLATKQLYYQDYSDQLALFLYAKQRYSRFSLFHKELKKNLI